MSINPLNLANEFDEIVNQRRSIRIYDKTAEFETAAVTRSLERAVLSPNSSNLQLWQFFHIKSAKAKQKIAEFCLNQPAAKTASEMVIIVTREDLWKERAKWNLDKVIESFDEQGKRASIIKDKPKDDAGSTLQSIANDDKEQRKKSVMKYYGELMPQLYNNDALGISGFFKKAFVNLVQGPKQPAYREVGKNDIRVIVHKSAALAAQTFMLSMTAEGYSTCPMEGFDSKRIKEFLDLPSGAEINMVISCGVGKPEGLYGKRFRVPNEEVIKVV